MASMDRKLSKTDVNIVKAPWRSRPAVEIIEKGGHCSLLLPHRYVVIYVFQGVFGRQTRGGSCTKSMTLCRKAFGGSPKGAGG